MDKADLHRAAKWQARDDAMWGRKADRRAEKARQREANVLRKTIIKWHASKYPLLLVKARLAGVSANQIALYSAMTPEKAWGMQRSLVFETQLAESRDSSYILWPTLDEEKI